MFIKGGGGDDLLDGGAGNDSLNAEGGLDSLVGGAGSDDFTGVDDVKELLDYNPEDFNLRARSKKIETNKNPRPDQAGILYSSPNAILNSWICFQQSISVVSNSRIAASWRLLSSMAS